VTVKIIWTKIQDKVGPLPLLSIAIILTFTILFLLFNQISKDKNDSINKAEEESIFERKRSKLIYLNEVMSSSIEMAYLSGDFKWVERYKKNPTNLKCSPMRSLKEYHSKKGER
jgi:hypothetical protein